MQGDLAARLAGAEETPDPAQSQALIVRVGAILNGGDTVHGRLLLPPGYFLFPKDVKVLHQFVGGTSKRWDSRNPPPPLPTQKYDQIQGIVAAAEKLAKRYSRGERSLETLSLLARIIIWRGAERVDIRYEEIMPDTFDRFLEELGWNPSNEPEIPPKTREWIRDDLCGPAKLTVKPSNNILCMDGDNREQLFTKAFEELEAVARSRSPSRAVLRDIRQERLRREEEGARLAQIQRLYGRWSDLSREVMGRLIGRYGEEAPVGPKRLISVSDQGRDSGRLRFSGRETVPLKTVRARVESGQVGISIRKTKAGLLLKLLSLRVDPGAARNPSVKAKRVADAGRRISDLGKFIGLWEGLPESAGMEEKLQRILVGGGTVEERERVAQAIRELQPDLEITAVEKIGEVRQLLGLSRWKDGRAALIVLDPRWVEWLKLPGTPLVPTAAFAQDSLPLDPAQMKEILSLQVKRLEESAIRARVLAWVMAREGAKRGRARRWAAGRPTRGWAPLPAVILPEWMEEIRKGVGRLKEKGMLEIPWGEERLIFLLRRYKSDYDEEEYLMFDALLRISDGGPLYLGRVDLRESFLTDLMVADEAAPWGAPFKEEGEVYLQKAGLLAAQSPFVSSRKETSPMEFFHISESILAAMGLERLPLERALWLAVAETLHLMYVRRINVFLHSSDAKALSRSRETLEKVLGPPSARVERPETERLSFSVELMRRRLTGPAASGAEEMEQVLRRIPEARAEGLTDWTGELRPRVSALRDAA